MFNFFTKKKKSSDFSANRCVEKKAINSAVNESSQKIARLEADLANKNYAKPDKYTNNRNLYDSGTAKANAKTNSFSSGEKVVDPYTKKELVLKKSDAKAEYGDKWTDYLAESDHIVPIEKVYNDSADNSWISNEDIKNIANGDDNIEIVSRKFNNAKRSRTNEDFVNDNGYLEKTGIVLSDEGKEAAISHGKNAQSSINKKAKKVSAQNAISTSHNAGVKAAKTATIHGATISGLMNISSFLKGDKTFDEALEDTALETGKAAASGYAISASLTSITHTLESSSSKFMNQIASANVPAKIVDAIMITGTSIVRYCNGEISTQDCIIEIGERGLTAATAGYSMTVGQALIPIPVVGAAIGALIGSMATSSVYNQLVNELKNRQLRQRERERIIAECKKTAEEERAYRAELEEYLKKYFNDYISCFDQALNQLDTAMSAGDANGVIAAANSITKKLGRDVKFNNVEEFRHFLDDDSVDVL